MNNIGKSNNKPIIQLGYSFCPNDTFIFHALHAGLINVPFDIKETLEDVQTLNDWAKEARLPMTKISYRAYFEVMDDYVALRAGGALGFGVGPLVVGRESIELGTGAGLTIASPGALTTAELLFRMVYPKACIVHMRYDEIMPAVLAGEWNGHPLHGGIIIHESRFTYGEQGLCQLFDLGAWWETETGLPLPLGAILVRRDLAAWHGVLNEAVVASLRYAQAHPDASLEYIAQHASELSPEVIAAHINLYVNELSLDVAEQGEAAVRELHRRAVVAGVVPACSLPLFID